MEPQSNVPSAGNDQPNKVTIRQVNPESIQDLHIYPSGNRPSIPEDRHPKESNTKSKKYKKLFLSLLIVIPILVIIAQIYIIARPSAQVKYLHSIKLPPYVKVIYGSDSWNGRFLGFCLSIDAPCDSKGFNLAELIIPSSINNKVFSKQDFLNDMTQILKQQGVTLINSSQNVEPPSSIPNSTPTTVYINTYSVPKSVPKCSTVRLQGNSTAAPYFLSCEPGG